MGGKAMTKFRNRILCTLPVVALMWSVQPAVAQAQFTQQGPKLVGTGALGPAEQGYSVAISSDGNTAIVGGPFDNSEGGAAWVYTRTGGVWSQQAKLVATDAIGRSAEQGFSVALSGDGNTAIVGGPADNDFFGVGAAWVYTRTGGVWSQQAKLVGTGAIGAANQGQSVSLSGDGNTAIVGGPCCIPGGGGPTGAAWVYTRTGAVWSQQAKLVGTDAIGPSAEQGFSVSLSGDGNTAIVGGPADNYQGITIGAAGAAWVYTRTGGVWSQQAKLVGAGAIGAANQGHSVSLSGDGNSAIVGGFGDAGFTGAAWVYTRTGGVWSQQAKLVGTDAIGPSAWQGFSVSLSGDGNTAIVGGPADNSQAPGSFPGVGAAWVFTRTGGVWSQEVKLVGAGVIGPAVQGYSVALSGDGDTAIVGGPFDDPQPPPGFPAGAAWVFAKPVFAGTPGKENCHGHSVSALARQFGGLNNAAAALGFPSVQALQDAIKTFCRVEGEREER
jgi:hypothetical protein